MAAGVFAKNITINSSSGAKSVNTILTGTNTYEKIIVKVVKIGPNKGAVNIGGSDVSASIFGMVLETGEEKEFYSGHNVASAVNIGANLFFFNPSSENIRLDVIGFATA
jgi:hypothetical protein